MKDTSLMVDMINLENTIPDATHTNPNWNNYDNEVFYQTLGIEGLLYFAEKSGLSSGCDIEILKPYWSAANSILDVGSGYGRVINHLVKHGYSGTITAVERCDTLYLYLKEKYKNFNAINILPRDIHYIAEIKNRFDLILFLWSGLADFSSKEQSIIIKNLAKLLNKEGKIIIDTMPRNTKPLQGEQFDTQSFLTRHKNTTVYTYEANINEVRQYAKDAGLYKIELLKCKTDINRERWLYICSTS